MVSSSDNKTEPHRRHQVRQLWALKIEQKGTGEVPAGRKGDVTKVCNLLGRIIKVFIHDDTWPTKSDSENKPKIRAAQRAAWKTPGDTTLMGLG